FELAHLLLHLLQLTLGDDGLIRLETSERTVVVHSLPAEHQARRDAVLARDGRDRLARLLGLAQQRLLLLEREMAASTWLPLLKHLDDLGCLRVRHVTVLSHASGPVFEGATSRLARMSPSS